MSNIFLQVTIGKKTLIPILGISEIEGGPPLRGEGSPLSYGHPHVALSIPASTVNVEHFPGSAIT